MKLPRVTGEKVIKALQDAGFSLVHIRGSHHYLHHPGHDCIVTVPVHAKKTLAPKTLKVHPRTGPSFFRRIHLVVVRVRSGPAVIYFPSA
jgi:predicted RNA binding protein YcfA (HicA-like mRNA interferase family)